MKLVAILYTLQAVASVTAHAPLETVPDASLLAALAHANMAETAKVAHTLAELRCKRDAGFVQLPDTGAPQSATLPLSCARGQFEAD